MIELRTLGSLDLRAADGRKLHSLLAQPKRIAVLAYLCIAAPPGYHRRDRLLGLFWPDANDVHGRNSLRNALHGLRTALGDQVILARGDHEVSVDFARIDCDACRFVEAARAGATSEALELYHGDLLPGFYIDDAPPFERWLESERTRLRELAIEAARLSAERLYVAGDHPGALHAARRALELSDLGERELRALLELLVKFGDLPGALKTYTAFAARLSAEFGTIPSSETRAVLDRIKGVGAVDGLEPIAGAASRLQQTVSDARVVTVATDDSFGARAPGASDVGTIGVVRRIRRGVGPIAIIMVAAALAVSLARDLVRPGASPPARRRQLTFSGNPIMSALSPDGNLLAYSVPSGDSEAVMLQNTSGGAPQRIVAVDFVNTIEWSPDGSRVLIGSDNRAILVPRAGQPLRELPMPPRFEVVVQAYWLPDGEHVSIHGNASRRIVIIDLRSDDTARIAVPTGLGLFEGAWSPDGEAFAVATTDGAGWQLRLLRRDGRADVLVRDTSSLASPRWGPGGNALYYARGGESVWRVATSTTTHLALGAPEQIRSELEILPNTGGRPIFTMSQNARRLTYTRGLRFANLWMIDSTSPASTPHAVPLTVGTALRWSPVVSPDGRWIAYVGILNGSAELFRIPIEGGEPTQITVGAAAARAELAWSPEGDRIVYLARRGHSRRLMIVDVGTGEMHEARTTRAPGADIAWAPGKRIAYQVEGNRNVILHDPASGDERALVASETTGWFFAPRYSPDARRLAVSANQPGGDFGITFFNLDGGPSQRARTRILFARGWSRDGRFLYAQGMRQMYRVDTRGGGAPEQVFTLPWRAPECSPAGPRRPTAFVCAAAEYLSDVWLIEDSTTASRDTASHS